MTLANAVAIRTDDRLNKSVAFVILKENQKFPPLAETSIVHGQRGKGYFPWQHNLAEKSKKIS